MPHARTSLTSVNNLVSTKVRQGVGKLQGKRQHRDVLEVGGGGYRVWGSGRSCGPSVGNDVLETATEEGHHHECRSRRRHGWIRVPHGKRLGGDIVDEMCKHREDVGVTPEAGVSIHRRPLALVAATHIAIHTTTTRKCEVPPLHTSSKVYLSPRNRRTAAQCHWFSTLRVVSLSV